MNRIAPDTLRVVFVTLLALCGGGGTAAAAETDARAEIRDAARESAPLETRVAALERASNAPAIGDPDGALRAAAALLDDAPEAALRLARRALAETRAPRELVLALADDARRSAGKSPARAAFAVLLGVRDDPALFGAEGPEGPGGSGSERTALSPEALAILREDAPEVASLASAQAAVATPVEDLRREWRRHAEVADLLDRAVDPPPTAPERATTPMQALLALGERALPHLLAVAGTPEGKSTPPGHLPRRLRAIVALGLLGDRRATPVLLSGLAGPDGWVRVSSAYALGDLGDPAAAVALARVLFYLGDRHRVLDSWDYPGLDNTPLTAEEWQSVEYHAIDSAAGDALLRLGVGNAGRWLVEQRLDPRRGAWRVRVLQDAVDALRRAYGALPVAYRPDGSVPDRLAAWRALLAWLDAERPRPKRSFDETDAGFRAAAAGLAAAVVGRSVMEQQIAGQSVELLGSAMTPTLLEMLPGESRRQRRAQVAVALGRTRDPRAVEALLGLAREPHGNVRGAAAGALEPHLRDARARDAVLALLADPEAEPRAAALEALASAPVDATVRAALERLRASEPAAARVDDGASFRVAWLVQTGEGLEEILALLRSEELWRRRQAWELLRRALSLPGDLYDPASPPPEGPAPDEALVRRALATRRGA
jgi:HEAT repeat protein